MKTRGCAVVAAVGVMFGVCSCSALLQTPLAVAPVGPAPGGTARADPAGFLTVYTHAEGHAYDEFEYYWAHTEYNVYTPTGAHVKSVRNGEYSQSPLPRKVVLPPGEYAVVGWSDTDQLVKVPVVIRAGQLTTVNLQADADSLFPKAQPSELVHTPDGKVVGWSAGLVKGN